MEFLGLELAISCVQQIVSAGTSQFTSCEVGNNPEQCTAPTKVAVSLTPSEAGTTQTETAKISMIPTETIEASMTPTETIEASMTPTETIEASMTPTETIEASMTPTETIEASMTSPGLPNTSGADTTALSPQPTRTQAGGSTSTAAGLTSQEPGTMTIEVTSTRGAVAMTPVEPTSTRSRGADNITPAGPTSTGARITVQATTQTVQETPTTPPLDNVDSPTKPTTTEAISLEASVRRTINASSSLSQILTLVCQNALAKRKIYLG